MSTNSDFPASLQTKLFERARAAQKNNLRKKAGPGVAAASASGGKKSRAPVVNGATPSNPDGWFVYSNTVGETCYMNGDSFAANKLNTCIPVSDTDAFVFNFDTELLQIDMHYYYNDLTCTSLTSTESYPVNVCETIEGVSEAYYGITGAEIFLYHEYLSRQLFLDANCSSSPLTYYALRNNYCFADGVNNAYKVEFPTLTSYNSLDSCSGAVNETKTFTPDLCEVNTPGAYDDSAEFSNYQISLIGKEYPFSVSEPSDGLSDGAIAGIVIGSVAGVAIIAAVIFFFACRK